MGDNSGGQWASRARPASAAVQQAVTSHPSGLPRPPGHRVIGGGVYDEGPIHAATDDAILKTYLTRLVLGDMITEVAVEGGVAGGVGGLAPPPPPAYTQVPRLADPHSATTMEEVARIARRVLGGAHPITTGIEISLRQARGTLRARETPPRSP